MNLHKRLVAMNSSVIVRPRPLRTSKGISLEQIVKRGQSAGSNRSYNNLLSLLDEIQNIIETDIGLLDKFISQ